MGTPNAQPFVPRLTNEEELFEYVIMSRLMLCGIQHAFDCVYHAYTRCDPDKRQIFEKGLKTVGIYCIPSAIFTACLKTYDLDFVRYIQLIYNYKPQLTSMLLSTFANTTSVYEKCFRINHYLRNFRTAAIFYTMHCLQLGSDSRNKCYKTLIKYAEGNEQLEPVCDFLRGRGVCLATLYVKCANYLALGLNKVKAAEIYAEVGEFKLALALYVELYKWEEAMCIINMMGLTEDSKKMKLSQLAVRLEDVRLFFGAATIYEILGSHWDAVRCFILADSFSKAVRVANTADPSMREYIYTALIKYVIELLQLFSNAKDTVENLTARIEVIWQQRILENSNQNSGNSSEETSTKETSDTETGQNSGNFNKERNTEENVTTSNTETSKNSENSNKEKNTEENIKMSDTQTGQNSGNVREQTNIKENIKTNDRKTSTGGPYEDIHILTTVYDEISKMSSMKPLLYDVVSTLHNFYDEATATYMESAYYIMLNTFKICITRIWYPEMNLTPQDLAKKLAAVGQNLHMIDHKYYLPPEIPKIPEEQVVE